MTSPWAFIGGNALNHQLLSLATHSIPLSHTDHEGGSAWDEMRRANGEKGTYLN
jgi:hypothetical protein